MSSHHFFPFHPKYWYWQYEWSMTKKDNILGFHYFQIICLVCRLQSHEVFSRASSAFLLAMKKIGVSAEGGMNDKHEK